MRGRQVGPDYFRIHPKGVGMVVARAQGLPPLTFVEEYLGEVHAPWRWFEIQARQVAICPDFQLCLHASLADVQGTSYRSLLQGLAASKADTAM